MWKSSTYIPPPCLRKIAREDRVNERGRHVVKHRIICAIVSGSVIGKCLQAVRVCRHSFRTLHTLGGRAHPMQGLSDDGRLNEGSLLKNGSPRKLGRRGTVCRSDVSLCNRSDSRSPVSTAYALCARARPGWEPGDATPRQGDRRGTPRHGENDHAHATLANRVFLRAPAPCFCT